MYVSLGLGGLGSLQEMNANLGVLVVKLPCCHNPHLMYDRIEPTYCWMAVNSHTIIRIPHSRQSTGKKKKKSNNQKSQIRRRKHNHNKPDNSTGAKSNSYKNERVTSRGKIADVWLITLINLNLFKFFRSGNPRKESIPEHLGTNKIVLLLSTRTQLFKRRLYRNNETRHPFCGLITWR